MITKLVPPDLIPRLRREHEAMGDGQDLGSPREVGEFTARRTKFVYTIAGLGLTSSLDKKLAQRLPLANARRVKVAARAKIEIEIAEAADWRTVSDPRERDREYGRQQARTASLKVLQHGCDYTADGQPMLPTPLREALTETCATCGHQALLWSGPIPVLDQQIAELDKTIAELEAALDAHLEAAADLLAAKV